ncbi:hypothetical protein [Chishuiella sp.]|uniref:hypothetical protein n=1 Tax=Chishuiella sp. TaxID=1969467 RepID=UPI0028A6954E|nr:hypothetical protein [Chishuiella sp.]
MKSNPMKKFTYIFLFSCSVISIFNSCKQFKNTITDTLTEKKSSIESINSLSNNNEEKEIPFFNNLEVLNQAENSLKNLPEFKGKSIFIYKNIYFYTNYRIILKLQNPDNPLFVDEYKYENGKWGEPSPIRLSKNDDVQSNVINLNRIPFRNVSNVYNALLEKQKEINSKASDITIDAQYYNNKINWYPTRISNERYEYEIRFNEDGTLESFEML